MALRMLGGVAHETGEMNAFFPKPSNMPRAPREPVDAKRSDVSHRLAKRCA